jgi:hypothetical protein
VRHAAAISAVTRACQRGMGCVRKRTGLLTACDALSLPLRQRRSIAVTVGASAVSAVCERPAALPAAAAAAIPTAAVA